MVIQTIIIRLLEPSSAEVMIIFSYIWFIVMLNQMVEARRPTLLVWVICNTLLVSYLAL